MWVCRNCETKNDDKDQYCACCGEMKYVNPAPKPTPPKPDPPPTPPKPDPPPAPPKPGTGTIPPKPGTTPPPATKKSSGGSSWGKRLLISVVASLIISFIYNNIDDLKLGSKTNSTTYSSSYSSSVSTPRPTAKATATPRPTAAQASNRKPVITSSKLNSSNQPHLEWQAVSGAKEYHIYYSMSYWGTYADFTSNPSAATETTVTGCEAGETYYFKIRAKMQDGTWSDYSDPVSISIPAGNSSSSSSSSYGSSQTSSADSYYVVGKMTNATFEKLTDKMRVNLDLKHHSIPSPTEDGTSYNNGEEYERYSIIRYDSSNEWESIGYIYNSRGQAIYIIRSWAGYHKNGPRIQLDVFYEPDGTYLGYQSWDITNSLSNSSRNSPYYMPSQGTHKLE